MHSFKDKTEREWNVDITVGAVKRVKEILKIDLLDPSVGDPPLLARLSIDDCLLCDVLFVICKPLADAAQITDVAFGEAMGGNALTAGHDALMESWADFFRQRRQETSALMVEKHRELVAMTWAETERRMNAIDLDQVKTLIVETLGTRSGKPLESPELATTQTL